MKRSELLKLLEKQYPSASADAEDFVGLQVKGKDEITSVLVTLDTTLEVIHQAIEHDVDMIITHHPLIFGERDQILQENKMIKAKYNLLESQKINLLAIHTNSDLNYESIAWAQAISLDLVNIEQLDENVGIKAEFKKESSLKDFVKLIRKQFELDYDFRTNSHEKEVFNKIIIGSGASGYLINLQTMPKTLFIVGEMKHNEWVYANENNIEVLEIGHFSEIFFKKMIDTLLKNNLIIIKSEEQNGYKAI